MSSYQNSIMDARNSWFNYFLRKTPNINEVSAAIDDVSVLVNHNLTAQVETNKRINAKDLRWSLFSKDLSKQPIECNTIILSKTDKRGRILTDKISINPGETAILGVSLKEPLNLNNRVAFIDTNGASTAFGHIKR